MHSPENILTLVVDEGTDAQISPSPVPVLLEYDAVTPTVLCHELCIDLEDEFLELEVKDKPDLLLNIGEQGPPGAPGTPGAVEVAVDTSAVQSGRMVYADANLHAAHTDSRNVISSFALGCFAGVNGRAIAIGRVDNMHFTDSSPTPLINQNVWLAAADDEPADAAAGKVTALVPSSGFAAKVGNVMSVGPDFATTRRAVVMVRIGLVIKRAP
jgi:hypothetical protein